MKLVALVCIAKLEDNYIQEWINYYLKLGVDDIFIYANDWHYTNNAEKIHIIDYPGDAQQVNAYNHFIINNYLNYEYVMFFDVDEFLTLLYHNSIQDFIADFDNNNGISVNWHLFGSNEFHMKDSFSCLKNFIRRSYYVHSLIKAILRLNKDNYMISPHHSNVPIMDTNKNYFCSHINPNGPTNVAYLNHYHYKTREEWIINRTKKGRADVPRNHPEHFRNLAEWNYAPLCVDVKDTIARDFLYNSGKKSPLFL